MSRTNVISPVEVWDKLIGSCATLERPPSFVVLKSVQKKRVTDRKLFLSGCPLSLWSQSFLNLLTLILEVFDLFLYLFFILLNPWVVFWFYTNFLVYHWILTFYLDLNWYYRLYLNYPNFRITFSSSILITWPFFQLCFDYVSSCFSPFFLLCLLSKLLYNLCQFSSLYIKNMTPGFPLFILPRLRYKVFYYRL